MLKMQREEISKGASYDQIVSSKSGEIGAELRKGPSTHEWRQGDNCGGKV